MDAGTKKTITEKDIEHFIEGRDPMERIVNLSYKYDDKMMTIYYRNDKDQKCVTKDYFYPFCWATLHACEKLCEGNRKEVKELLRKYNIGVKRLSNTSIEGEVREEFNDGYLFKFFAKEPMSYQRFLAFFREAKNPIYNKKDKEGNVIIKDKADERQYLIVTPQEQYMIATGRRFFKGYMDYDEIYRMIFDLETEGLDPRRHRIAQVGIRTNRGFEKIFTIKGDSKEELDKNELEAIETMIKIIYTYRPDIITAHNGENFDWNFLIVRCEMLGTSMEALSSRYFNGEFIKKEKKESVLKLGGEIEKFFKTIVPNTTVTDSLHAVRRAQAIDSNMLRADLKYATKYAKMTKPNRVYVPGDKINKTWADTVNDYAFNDENGDWYMITSVSPLKDGYTIVSGRYIVERYLLDDLWECDKVEWKFNTTNFLICKLLPVPYAKCTTMGTAGQWKALMLAWSYENDLAIPMAKDTGAFTGGLSRLLRVGFVDNVVKLDYNSLYPSIILTWGISDTNDLMGVMLKFLEYVLTQREKYKGEKKNAGKIVDELKGFIQAMLASKEQIEKFNKAGADYAFSDKKQAQMKVFGNSFFGSYGSNSGSVFPWKSPKCAEQTTCTGRQCLRLMISHFSGLGYSPIVGDTDGFNFKLPDESTYRYTKEHPYIGKGSNREVKLGKEYSSFEADVAEFNDLYMNKVYSPKGVQKMGLGIDEVVSATINFSRKNYADYFPENPFPEDVKMVGNTIKSKKMPEYISKFLSVGIRLLLQGKGQEFIEEYYKYLDKIYNYNIPLRDIATKGKIKKSIDEYLKDIKTITKAGRPKSRQAWYELAIKNNLKVDNGDTVYYINIGKTKSHSDAKKVTHYYINDLFGEKEEISKNIEREYKIYTKECKEKGIEKLSKDEWISKAYPNAIKEEEVKLNCVLVPREVIEKDEDTFCDNFIVDNEQVWYNCPKYIKAFNDRIKPLLVCFSKEIRDSILIENPDDRLFFTEEQCKLSSGEPNKITDQDTYEQLMTMEDKEIKFWMTYNLEPPFLEECKMGKWEDIKNDYINRMEEEKRLGIDIEKNTYNTIIDSMSNEDIDKFIEDGELPSKLFDIVDIDAVTANFVSKRYPDITIGHLSDILEIQLSKSKTNVLD